MWWWQLGLAVGCFLTQVPPQELVIGSPEKTSRSSVPYFTVHSDNSIIWDDMGWCVEASGRASGDAVRVNQCNGDAAQKWNWIPDGLGRNMIQLKNTNKCFDLEKSSSDKASIELRDCGSQITYAWKLDRSLPFPILATPATSGIRRTLVSLLSISGVGILGLVACMWRQQNKARVVAPGQGGVSMSVLASGDIEANMCPVANARRAGNVSMMASAGADMDWSKKIENGIADAKKKFDQKCFAMKMDLGSPPEMVNVHERVNGKHVNLDDLPVAFTPTSSSTQAPGHLEKQAELIIGHAVRLRDYGYTVIPDAGLDLDLVADARSACSAELETLLDGVTCLGVDCVEQEYLFNEVATRHRMRWDFRPSSNSAWTQLVGEAVAAASPIVECLHDMPPCPDDTWLPELTGWTRLVMPKSPQVKQVGAVISRPGARAQRFHSDSADDHFQLAKLFPRHRMYNVFVPLVDIDEGGDGTMLWPGSHLEATRCSNYFEAIARAGHLEDDARAMAEMVVPACPAGGIILFDFRLLHRGMPSAGRERAMAYAILSTGWAWDSTNFPPTSLWRELDALPLDPQERQEKQVENGENYPFWSELPERETDEMPEGRQVETPSSVK